MAVFNSQDLKGVSRRAKNLLIKREVECLDAEWKESVAGLDPSDFVAFANSLNGGAILIGINDKTLVIKDTSLTDELKNKILGKANSCSPPITVDMFEEKVKSGRFVRIEVPSGEFKPYCTSGGN